MDLNRNQFYMLGLVILLLGLQFRAIDSVVLTPKFTRLLAEIAGSPVISASETANAVLGTQTPVPGTTFRPPDWLGWSLLSVGCVLILHSMAMRRPSD